MDTRRGTRRSLRLSDSKKSRTLVQEKEKKRPSSAAKVKGKTQKSSVVNKDNEATATKAPIHSTRSEDTVAEECGKRTNTSDQPPPKRKTKVMNVKERKLLVEFLDSGDDTILAEDVKDDLKQQLLADKLKNLVKILCSHEQLLIQLISCHRKCFSQLYLDCKKMSDPMLNFQLCWHNQCSAFLLSQEHNIAVLNLKELSGCNVCHTRDAWLQFCSANGVPVPESNPVMMTITSTIYRVLLESVMNFQESLTATNAVATASEYKDGDDVYYRFGGATICEMLKLHYKQIRSCSDEQRDHLSQEIVILQAMKTDDKSIIPDYLKYRDRGYMYFPHGTFIPFLKAVDDTVKRVVNPDGLEENGSELIKVAHKMLETRSDIHEMFKTALEQRLPNFSTISEKAVHSVFDVMVRKLCNTRVQEFISSTKQQFATKKGLASTVDVNLRTTLLVHHTKLETKLTT